MAQCVKMIGGDGDFIICAIDGGSLLDDVVRIHQLEPIVASALNRLLMTTALIAATEKESDTSIAVSITGEAAVSKMVTYACGDVLKGFCDMRFALDGAVDKYGKLFDGGQMTVTKQYANGMHSTGQAALVSGDIATDFTHYYLHSEQQAVLFVIDEAVSADKTHCSAVMLSLLPQADAAVAAQISERLDDFKNIAAQLASGVDLTTLLSKICAALPHRVVEQRALSYRCDCSRQKMESALISIGLKDLTALRDEDGSAELNCHFCGQSYQFDKAALEHLIEELHS